MAATGTRASDGPVRHRSNPWRIALVVWSTRRWGSGRGHGRSYGIRGCTGSQNTRQNTALR